MGVKFARQLSEITCMGQYRAAALSNWFSWTTVSKTQPVLWNINTIAMQSFSIQKIIM